MKKTAVVSYLALICGFNPLHTAASVYIGTQDKQLHYDVQTLVEWGYIDATAYTFPIAWKGVSQQLATISELELPSVPQQALLRLQHYLNVHRQQKNRSYIDLQLASNERRFSSLDDKTEQKQTVKLTTEFYSGRLSGQLSLNALAGGEYNLDHSFMVYQLGDWNIRLGSIDQWWGPAQSSSLIMSNNARPIKALSLSRSTNTRSNHPWLSWLGPWFATAQLGQLEAERSVPNTKFIMNRFTARPFKGFEFGMSWTAMWGGDGQPDGFDDFIDVITFKAICLEPEPTCSEQGLQTKRGNHMAGYDISYSTHLFGRPWSLYAQRIGEDAVDGYRITDNAYLYGLSTYIGNAKVFIETSDTNISCASSTSTITNCYYENADYPSGYRMYERSIGSTYDSDAKHITMGANFRFKNGTVAQIYLRDIKLNPDGIRPSPVLNEQSSEDVKQISGFVKFPFKKTLISLGGEISHRQFAEADDITQTEVFARIKYAF